MRPGARRLVATTLASAAFVLGLAGCGDDSGGDDGGDEPTETTSPADDTAVDETTAGGGEGAAAVSMAGFAFDPTELVVPAGGTITITNTDGANHTFTADDAGIDVEVGGGSSGTATAPAEPGEYEFRCRFHSNMQGVLTVAS